MWIRRNNKPIESLLWLLVVVGASLTLISLLGYGGYDAYQRNLKFKYFIVHQESVYKTEKIDSVSNGTVYFKDQDGNNTIIRGEYVIKEVNR